MKRPDEKWETTLYYAWLHISTGREGKRSMTLPYSRVVAIQVLDALIDSWNKQQPKRWEYKRITKS